MSLFKHNDDVPFHKEYQGDLSRCLLCNRKVGKHPLMLEVYGGGAILDRHIEREPDISDGGYMGLYPVGSECAKQFAEGVLIKSV